jgi:nitroimidazol reductase NimA-like FMN-containing flavoprotein (pyridoxamine 5'-phosphate oxidase superfamily)
MREPQARPARGPSGYPFPTTSENLLAWHDAEQRLVEARFYWLGTANPDGSPHVRPLWGVWIDGCLYFDGHPRTRWGRNLAREPRASLHLESAARVVIVDGVGEDVEQTSQELGDAIASAWQAKYGRLVPDPATRGIFRLSPRRAYAWSENLQDATVWELDGD